MWSDILLVVFISIGTAFLGGGLLGLWNLEKKNTKNLENLEVERQNKKSETAAWRRSLMSKLMRMLIYEHIVSELL